MYVTEVATIRAAALERLPLPPRLPTFDGAPRTLWSASGTFAAHAASTVAPRPREAA